MRTRPTTRKPVRPRPAPRRPIVWRMVCLLMAFVLALNIPLRPRGADPVRAASISPHVQATTGSPVPNAQTVAGNPAPRPCCHGVCHCNMQHPMPGMACCRNACPCSHHPRPSAVLLASTDQPYLLPDTIPAAMPPGAVVRCPRPRPAATPARAAYPPTQPPERLS